MKNLKQIELLKNDFNYYGEFGKQFLSSSDMKVLNEQPDKFHADEKGNNLPLLKGSYFHTMILEPEKIGNHIIFDGASRNSKAYKDFEVDYGFCLLQKEVDELNNLFLAIRKKDIIKQLLNAEGESEVPMITEIHGKLFKGKADRLNHSAKLCIDIKTTADIERFKYSAREYYYDCQAYIYNKHFGYDVIFIVCCKKRQTVKIFTCSEDFYKSGEDRLINALRNYNTFYSEDSLEDVEQFVPTIEL